MAKYAPGDEVIVKVENQNYSGTVITSAPNTENEEVYLVSVTGLGQCYSFKETDIVE